MTQGGAITFIAYPLRLHDGFVQRNDDVHAIFTILRVMASTPHGSWAGCPHFGIRDFFEGARTRPELVGAAVKEANLALRDLGIVNFEIDSITKEAQRQRDVDEYKVTLLDAMGKKLTLPLGVL